MKSEGIVVGVGAADDEVVEDDDGVYVGVGVVVVVVDVFETELEVEVDLVLVEVVLGGSHLLEDVVGVGVGVPLPNSQVPYNRPAPESEKN